METAKQAAELLFACIGAGICIGVAAAFTAMTYRLCRKIF